MSSESLFDFANVDCEKTAEKVLIFLTIYYPRLERMCTSANPKNLQSPMISDMPTRTSVNNSFEDKMQRYLASKVIVDAVHSTLQKGSKELRVVYDNVVGKIPAWQAMSALHLEKTKYYEVRKKALNEFADIFEMQSYYCPDLHVYN